MQTWGLNDGSTGGLTSHMLALLVMAYFMGPKPPSVNAQSPLKRLSMHPGYRNMNLGVHLLGVLELYGDLFDYATEAICLWQVCVPCNMRY